jgi:RNA polymerase sigma factor (sigma-70 family)
MESVRRQSTPVEVRTMCESPSTAALVGRTISGDKTAWDAIVERYAPLVWSVCQRFGLTRAETERVGGTVWLRLIEALPSLPDPAALPGWLATATHRECLSLRQFPLEIADILEAEELNLALREAFATLPERDRQLLTMLSADPPVPHAKISETLGIPIDTIEPTRQRCLTHLRHTALGLVSATTDS